MAEADPKLLAPPAPVIVKKVTIQAAGHHGGAWKVAYADFVTAMMAFFLLLWLLGATEEKQRKGIADYFTPTLVKMRKESAGSDGLLGGSSITDADNYPNAMGQTGTRAITIPRGVTGGPVEGGGRGELDFGQAQGTARQDRKKAGPAPPAFAPCTAGAGDARTPKASASIWSMMPISRCSSWAPQFLTGEATRFAGRHGRDAAGRTCAADPARPHRFAAVAQRGGRQ